MMRNDWLVLITEEEWKFFVHEGEKSIASHKAAKKLVRKLGGSKRILPPEGLRIGRTERLINLKKDYRGKLHAVFKKVYKGTLTTERAVSLLRGVFSTYFKYAYALGLQTQGVGRTFSLKEVISKFKREDIFHIRTMVEEEARYVKGFIKAVQERSFRMSYGTRLKLYVNGLEGVYGGARIAALESRSLLYWVGPRDKNKCPSCWYMVEASPFLPRTLPTTPRAGDTVCLCLTDCKVEIETSRGIISFEDVVVGDRVKTHAERFQRVTAQVTHRSSQRHCYAVAVGSKGRLFGVTSDHLLMTTKGWRPAAEIANGGFRVVQGAQSTAQEKYHGVEKGNKEGASESFLLSELLQQAQECGNADPCVQLLRHEVQKKGVGTQEVEVGQVLLLEGMLPEGSPLYDLEVEDDSSFCVNGLVAHNSNCRDRIVARKGLDEEVRMVMVGGLSRRQHLANLKKIRETKALKRGKRKIYPPGPSIPL